MSQPYKKLLLIADAFPPMKTSAAVQLQDLAEELVNQGFELTILLPSSSLKTYSEVKAQCGYRMITVKTPKFKHTNYFLRTVFEFLMPFYMELRLKKCGLLGNDFDAVIWYSPTIFFGPLVKKFKDSSNCKSYLILRDIFPDWALDMGILKPGIIYWYFSKVAKYQYSIADVIGVQTEGNLSYFNYLSKDSGTRVEVLNNWLSRRPSSISSIDINKTKLSKKKILIYLGNMGVAQGVSNILDLAKSLRNDKKIGFLLVGRGSEQKKMELRAKKERLNNVMFHKEIDPDEIPHLLDQCHIGMVFLDPRHKSHNIPGKFLSYIQNGLPVIAHINKGNDLSKLILDFKVGEVSETGSLKELQKKTLRLVSRLEKKNKFSENCVRLYEEYYSTRAAVSKITKSIFVDNNIKRRNAS